MYARGVATREKSTMLHLFGIVYAGELDGRDVASLEEIAESATGHRSYGREIKKMVRLAKYVNVELKAQYRDEF